ncbi:MAG TPA: hypothetical protein VIF09_26200 [Polyangiaceae bacterium]|jgi:hypothetical protein
MKPSPWSNPYREVGTPPADEEAAAMAWLVARARRIRRVVGIPILLAGLVAAAVGDRLLGSVLFEAIESRAPYITVLVTAFPIFVLGQALAAYAGRRAVLARSRAWIDQIGTSPAVSTTLLEAFVRLL